ncbi:hypothetical protein AKJ57_02140 [candidate division MSBL1 archaeon SCGC-AAA259A05]|uniref:DUF4258 domain-containing protein n=1 Tax=candidate division MSBL1 archaeon SCGC-AAA259A05 TaxID=1698259 RepID=A0A133UAL2_9EURY|nr:hypothetical protein AKJ57_02140 [candidate division MSBL1 archaeon SCGC-AAA259A05]
MKDEGKKIEFTSHAEEKLGRLKEIGVTRRKILKTVRNPDKTVDGRYGRKIAQTLLREDIILRVVYEETEEKITIVTVYPGKRRRYE